jgi:hypothetical protein
MAVPDLQLAAAWIHLEFGRDGSMKSMQEPTDHHQRGCTAPASCSQGKRICIYIFLSKSGRKAAIILKKIQIG